MQLLPLCVLFSIQAEKPSGPLDLEVSRDVSNSWVWLSEHRREAGTSPLVKGTIGQTGGTDWLKHLEKRRWDHYGFLQIWLARVIIMNYGASRGVLLGQVFDRPPKLILIIGRVQVVKEMFLAQRSCENNSVPSTFVLRDMYRVVRPFGIFEQGVSSHRLYHGYVQLGRIFLGIHLSMIDRKDSCHCIHDFSMSSSHMICIPVCFWNQVAGFTELSMCVPPDSPSAWICFTGWGFPLDFQV